MEGYLLLKRTISWEKVWVVLERQQLSYYESLDLKTQEAKSIKGFVILKNADVRKIKENGRENCIQIIMAAIEVPKSKSPAVLTFQCDGEGSAQLCSTWFLMLTKASQLEKEEEKKNSEPTLHRAVLGFGKS